MVNDFRARETQIYQLSRLSDLETWHLCDVVTHVIDTGDSIPIKQHPRRIPFSLRSRVDQLVSEMLYQGIVVPSKSPWASPVVLVAKKDGSTRFCVDYRRLNAVTKTDVFPLPRVDDSLDQLSNSRYFTTLDLAAGYWQVLVEPKSREKTAFVTHSGLFEFSVMPFGLKNAPATFQRLIETVLSGLIRHVCLDYLDDIIVTGRTFDEHLANLRSVFLRLRDAHLKLKPRKCFLAMKEVEYLGFRVSGEGIIADPKKIEAVQHYPTPADVKQVRSFVGLASYYRRSDPQSPSKGGDLSLSDLQRRDRTLAPYFAYLEDKVLPDEEPDARELVLSKSQYTVVDDTLYYVEKDKTLKVIPPLVYRKKLFDEVHSGKFAGHLRDAKMHSLLSKHYWWPGMRKDICRWCKSCLTCATRHVGRVIRPPLVPIPVSGPFDRLGVDVVQFPKSKRGNKYAIVFIDYLTKWVEVFPTADQSALTIAHLLVEEIISRHGVPKELLSDRGAAFLSKLMNEIYLLMGIYKVYTTAYHPQTDGLVERFHRTLTSMLAKTTCAGGLDWDERLPFVLFSYRCSVQQSTGESPFFLMYGRDPQLPTEDALSKPQERCYLDSDDYRTQLTQTLSDAWERAQKNVKAAQNRQKTQHDRKTRMPKFVIGDRVFVYKPAAKSCKAYKFARPFHGPYRIIQLYDGGADVTLVDRPKEPSIRVPFERLRVCPDEVPDVSWPPKASSSKSHVDSDPKSNPLPSSTATSAPATTLACGVGDSVIESDWSRRPE